MGEMADREHVGDGGQPAGMTAVGTKIPEMKNRGSITSCTVGCAESADPIAVTTA